MEDWRKCERGFGRDEGRKSGIAGRIVGETKD
jgi:hypothetical protein